MYNNLLAVADKTRAVPIAEAALYALLGFIVVFLGISFLILMVWLVGKVIAKANGVAVKTVKEKTTVNPEITESLAVADSESISDETIAVIMAALTAYYEKSSAKCEFTVKRIKRI